MIKKDYRKVGIGDLRDIFGHAVSSLNDWRKDGSMPKFREAGDKKDYYDTIKVYHFFLSKDVKKIIGEADVEDDSGEPSDYLERFRKYSAETKKFDLRIKKGEYISRDQILLDLRLLVTHAQKEFQSMGRELAFELSKNSDVESIEAIINEKVFSILEKISMSTIDDQRQERGDDEE